PLALVRALSARGPKLSDVEIVHLLTFGEAPYASRQLEGLFTVNSFFVAQNVRGMIQEGLGNYTPIFLSDIPRLFSSGRLPLDAALIQVSPPDHRGMVSLGISVDIVKSAAENASLVIAQVNEYFPRTMGNSFISVYDLDLLAPVNEPLVERPAVEINDVTDAIGRNIASLVDDYSTVELGIGRIPQAAMLHLAGKKDLGVHTEMITDGIIDLVESGVVTGTRKKLDREKVVASFAIGTRKLFDYVSNNSKFAFHPTEYVNDPFVIAQHRKMVAINTALEVDLTGQVCADSIGSKFFSGIGGQVDFNRGAARSIGGKAIIALPSTARNGAVSRIVSHLTPGAGVVTTRGDVHYIVTEYGVAYMHGKSAAERAMALIAIAHPDFRAELVERAIEAKLLRPEKREIEGVIAINPREMKTSMALRDGTQINFRSILPTDETNVRDMLYHISEKSIRFRFMTEIQRFPYHQIQNFVYIDNRKDVAIVGYMPAAHGDEIIAMGRYYLDETTNRAEVAFVVRDEWQGKGIGAFMLEILAKTARRNGIKGLTATVLRENMAMQAVFNKKADMQVKSSLEGDVYYFQMDFVE
ncbi:MAG: GNAT family N-acetyltransferase, partial [Nitrospinota bacterium]|nr:GNAT family N-acetyltransferase [Nitrospinota bacterium]